MSSRNQGVLVAGLVLVCMGPVLGIIITVAGMIGAFRQLGDQGISNPSTLAGHIGSALLATEIGLVVALVGGSLIAVATISHLASRPPREADAASARQALKESSQFRR